MSESFTDNVATHTGHATPRERGALSHESLVEQLPVAAYACDAQGNVTYLNHRAVEVFGSAPPVNAPLARAMETGKDYLEEIVIERPGGGRLTALAHANPIRDEEGRILGAMCALIDVSEGKRLEATLRFLAEASAALGEVTDYEGTLQNIAKLAVPAFADWCGVMVRDAGGTFRRIAVHHQESSRVETVEELFRRYPPLPTDEYGAMRVLRVGEPLFVPAVTDPILEAIARTPEHLAMLKSVQMRSYICVPMRSRQGILGTLTFVCAESGREYVETDLRAAEDLAHRAAIAIENAQLLQALKDADRRKDEFLAMLAHELRNPLAPVRNAVQILRASQPGSDQAGWAHDVIDRQVRQMARLVDDLLDVSRITMGKIELRKERVSLGAAIATAVEASRPVIERGRHNLTVHVPPEPVHLEADLARLAQILSNLLNNAAKYTDPGGHIGLAVERVGREVAIHVTDTGVGIPPEMLDRVFEMFTQVERASDHSHGGLGIGLTLVKSLTELHGGRVQARSAGPGKGSEFIVSFPCLEDLSATAPRLKPLATEPSERRRILVVDDNRDAADSLAMLLRAKGNEVRVAYDGLEAVGAAIAFLPDVVLLDIGLPKLYGHEAARRIREARGKDVLLIAVTGWGQEEDRKRSREAGFDHHLTKPVEFEVLQRLLVPK